MVAGLKRLKRPDQGVEVFENLTGSAIEIAFTNAVTDEHLSAEIPVDLWQRDTEGPIADIDRPTVVIGKDRRPRVLLPTLIEVIGPDTRNARGAIAPWISST